jgi:hypothetical protein
MARARAPAPREGLRDCVHVVAPGSRETISPSVDANHVPAGSPHTLATLIGTSTHRQLCPPLTDCMSCPLAVTAQPDVGVTKSVDVNVAPPGSDVFDQLRPPSDV